VSILINFKRITWQIESQLLCQFHWEATHGVAIGSDLNKKLIVAEFGILPERRCCVVAPFLI
jgi:hypothetical protein